MFANPTAGWYHGNPYNARTACEHCAGVVRHKPWCITCNAFVQYAYAVLKDPEKLTFRDRLILHALGVAWVRHPSEEDATMIAVPGQIHHRG